MTFAVFWSTPTEQELANAWLLARDREAVVRAAHQIDQLLAPRPAGFR